MKVLMYAGIEPGANPTIGDILTKKYDVGDNTGNLLFINAVAESLGLMNGDRIVITHYRTNFSDSEIAMLNEKYDCFILPMADAFREDNIQQLKCLTKLIKKLQIPSYVIGIGLRASYDSDINEPQPFDEIAKEFVKAVLEKSTCLGLRGERTALYLKRLGFKEKDFVPIGCPSMCMAAAGIGVNIRDISLNSDFKIALNGNDLAPDNVSKLFRKIILRYPNTYVVQQRESEIADIYLGKYSDYRNNAFRVKGSLYGETIYNNLVIENKVRFFPNIYRWSEFLEGMDFCLNSRFHGSVVSLLAGTPTVIVPIDSRMQELVEYHKIPQIPAKDIHDSYSLDEILERVDIHSPEKVAEQNLRNYFTFLDKNGLSHVDYTYNPSYRLYSDNTHRTTWKYPEEPFIELSSSAKILRASSYYLSKYTNKIVNKIRPFQY